MSVVSGGFRLLTFPGPVDLPSIGPHFFPGRTRRGDVPHVIGQRHDRVEDRRFLVGRLRLGRIFAASIGDAPNTSPTPASFVVQHTGEITLALLSRMIPPPLSPGETLSRNLH